MADEYTPTTEQVRASALGFTMLRSPEHWDNWLAAHDRATAARAWDEGFHSAEEQHDGYIGVSGWANNNPYREEN